ncbi:Biotin biosynthesis cytochrome P450 [Roseovarius albus]|uniref:Biotin biosynthesis cytochrome P450 n=1 Tax=Roseovarius albus TaxID=1247867 RepID=A0A1X6ZTS4_9RHOB|nr:cytochrome P450 [Roseovarius albus]SLN60789.1 Biotin biosynthesis cytochrome P450 [Roseovarius albus]
MKASEIMSLSIQQYPYETYKQQREIAPLAWDDSVNAWAAYKFADISKVLKSKEFSAERVSRARHRYKPEFQPVFDIIARIMIQVDDPVHRHLRDATHAAFTRTAVVEYEADIRERCKRLLKPGLERGEIEFMSEFSVPLPLLVIAKIVGVPSEDLQQIKEWCDAYSWIILKFYTHIDDADLEVRSKQVMDFVHYLDEKVEAALKSPKEDLLSSLALAARDQGILTREQVTANLMILLNAGNETTTCVLGNGVRLLLEHPDQRQLLKDDPSLIPNAIEEIMRFETPVTISGRIATTDLELGGQTIHQEELVLMFLASGNRDPERFENPDKFDVTRTRNHHLSFGTGTHLCAGIQLARFEAKVAFEFLLPYLDRFELLETTVTWADNLNLRGPKHMNLRIHKA